MLFDAFVRPVVADAVGTPHADPVDAIVAFALSTPFGDLAKSLPDFTLSASFDAYMSSTPGESLGAPWEGPASALPAPAYPPICISLDSDDLAQLDERMDSAPIALIRRITSGQCSLWDDANAGSITIGGGATHTTTAIGKAGEELRIADKLSVLDDSIELLADDMLVGSELDLALDARSASILLNDSSNLLPTTPFYSSTGVSLVGAVNEALEAAAQFIAVDLTNNNAGTLSLGTVVSPSGVNGVDLADASTDNTASRAVGVAAEAILTTATGTIALAGEVTMRFEAGEGVGPHVSSRVFLSASPGFATLAAPAAMGNVELTLGIVVDDSGYINGSGGTMVVQTIRGQRKVVT